MKILLMDIETAPSNGWIWSLWTEIRSMAMMEDDWYILCWCAKWLGEKEIMSSALPDHKGYKRNPKNDKKIMEALWKLLDEADVVIAHNGKKFDRKKVNTRFLIHGMTPPSPYKVIDTLLVARREFSFLSNKLNDLGQFLKLGKKLETGGFDLWRGCMDGDIKSWNKMVRYNKQDVRLLEKVYLVLRPYIVNHPNFGVYDDSERPRCPKCGSTKIHYRGYSYTNVSKFHQFVCNKCGGWGRLRVNCLTKEKIKSLTINS